MTEVSTQAKLERAVEQSKGFSPWYGLVISALIASGMGLSLTSMPSLFKEMARDLNLNFAQLGAIWGMNSLSGVFLGIPVGLMGDRFGVRIITGIGCFAAAGAIALLGGSGSIAPLLIFVFSYGISSHLVSGNRPKAIRIWFEPRQLGLANGICGATFAGAGTLAMLFAATVFSPLFGGWRVVMWVNASILALLGFVWFFIIKESAFYIKENGTNTGTGPSRVSFREALLHAVRIKDVWIIGIASFAFITCAMSLVGYLPVFFEREGMSSEAAHNVASVAIFGFFVGNFLVPFISDRVGLRKAVFMAAAAVIATSVFLIPFLEGPRLTVSVFLYGVAGGGASMGSLMVTEMKQIGPIYAGTAVGLAMTVSGLGGVLGPIVGGAIGDIDPAKPFIFWSAMALASIIPMLFVKETGYRARRAAG